MDTRKVPFWRKPILRKDLSAGQRLSFAISSAALLCSCSAPRPDATPKGVVSACEVVASPRKFDGRNIEVRGFVIIVRHGMYLVADKDFSCQIGIGLSEKVDARDPSVSEFLRVAYQKPLREAWREMDVVLLGRYDWNKDSYDTHWIQVESVLSVMRGRDEPESFSDSCCLPADVDINWCTD